MNLPKINMKSPLFISLSVLFVLIVVANIIVPKSNWASLFHVKQIATVAQDNPDFSYRLINNDTEAEIAGYSGYYTHGLYDVTIPSVLDGFPVTSIGVNSFQWSPITSVIIPDSVTNIKGAAFYKNQELTSVIIGNGVTTIGDQAFSYSPKLTSIVIPDSVTSLGSAFQVCTGLKTAIIGNGVTGIAQNTFYHSGLKSVIVGSSVMELGYSAFDDSRELTDIYFLGDAPAIAGGVFFGEPTIHYIEGKAGWTNPWNSYPTATFTDMPTFLACGSTITTDTTLGWDMSCPTGNGINIGADNITLDCSGQKITNPSGTQNFSGILLNERKGVTVKRCKVSGFNAGVSSMSGSYITLDSNVTSNNWNGIDLEPGSNSQNSNYNIVNNTAEFNGNGIVFYGSHSTITNNLTRSNGTGIYTAGDGNTLDFNTSDSNGYVGIMNGGNDDIVSNNITNSNGMFGIFDYTSSRTILTNNTANSNTNYGFRITESSGDTLSGNTADLNGEEGIRLESSPSNTITNNTITNSTRCIKMTSSNNTAIRNNICENGTQGIVSDPSSNNIIDSNKIDGMKGAAIFLDTSTNDSAVNNIIKNVLIGIMVSNSDGSKVTGNDVQSSTDAIAILTSSNTTIASNVLVNNIVNAPVIDTTSAVTTVTDVPAAIDSDNDGLPDQQEIALGTNPNLADTDKDGLTDGQEVLIYRTNPLLVDTDGDGAKDGGEVINGYDPLDPNSVPPDMDGDGVNDDIDQCPEVIGTVQLNGCPFASKAIIDMQTVDQQKSGVCGYDSKGKPKTDCKSLLAGAEVRLFDRENTDFVSLYKSKRPDKKQFDLIFEGGVGQMSACTTDDTGSCIIGADHSGKYLMIAKYVDGANTVYTGKYQNFKRSAIATEEEDDADTDAKIAKDTLLQKKLHFMKTIQKNGTIKYSAGTMAVFTGSELNILYPEYTIWNGASELYPFVMTSDSDWTVDVCLQVPTGYSIKGVQDIDGNIVGTSNCSQTLVSGQPAIVLFSLADIGSPEPKIGMSINTIHKGKKAKKDVTIDGIRKKSKDVEEKDLKVKVNKKKIEDLRKKAKDIQEKTLKIKKDKQDKEFKAKADQNGTAQKGESLWSKIKSVF